MNGDRDTTMGRADKGCIVREATKHREQGAGLAKHFGGSKASQKSNLERIGTYAALVLFLIDSLPKPSLAHVERGLNLIFCSPKRRRL